MSRSTEQRVRVSSPDRVRVDLLALDALHRPWRVSVARRVDLDGEQLVQRVDFSSAGRGSVVRVIASRSGDPPIWRSTRSVETFSVEQVVRRIEGRIESGGWRLLRFGWGATEIAEAFAAVCFHPATVDQIADVIERESLSRIDLDEIVSGSIADVARRLRLRRLSLWVPPATLGGSGVYAVGTDSDEGVDRSLLARIDPSRVRLAEEEIADAAHEGPT